MGSRLDQIAAGTAHRLLGWASRHATPERRGWLEAARAELEVIEGGSAQLAWAMSGLRLWFEGRSPMAWLLDRIGILLLDLLAVALVAALAINLAQSYTVLAVALLALSIVGTLVAVVLISGLVKLAGEMVRLLLARRTLGQWQQRWIKTSLTVAAAVVTLGVLLALSLGAWATTAQLIAQGPPTAAVIASPADHTQVEAQLAYLAKTADLPRPDTYLTTQVTPVAINGVPLGQWIHQLDPKGLMQPQNLQHRFGKFASIQGFDLAHGQLPDGTRIAFLPSLGAGVEHNLGRDGKTVAPQGRLLDAHDANTLNVLIPVEADWSVADQVCCVDYYNGDTVTVQSQADGRTLTLHVVGVYQEDGATTNLFGGILADDTVVRALSGGASTYAYALRLDAGQRGTLIQRLHASVPTARVTALTNADPSIPGASFSNLRSEEISWISAYWGLTGQIVALWSLLAATLIVSNMRARRLLAWSRAPQVSPDGAGALGASVG